MRQPNTENSHELDSHLLLVWFAKLRPVVIFVMYYYCWILCAQAGAVGETTQALLFTAGATMFFVLCHWRKLSFMAFIALLTVLGSACDGALNLLGLYEFNHGSRILLWPPTWFLGFWALFAGIVPHSFPWLERRYVLAGALGVIFAPISYYAGIKMGAITVNGSMTVYLCAVAIEWGIALPAIVILAERMNLFPTHELSPPID